MATVALVTRCGTNHVLGCPCTYCAEIRRLTAERDALAAEHHFMHVVLANIRARLKTGIAFDLSATGLYDPRVMCNPKSDIALAAARVKALEAVVESSKVMDRLRDQILCHFDAPEDILELGEFFDALDALAALDKVEKGNG